MSSDNSENKNELERLFGIWVTPDKKAEAVFNLLNKSKGRFIRNAIFQMCGIRLHKNPPTYTEGNENKVTKNKIGYSFYYGKWDYEHFFSEYRTDIIRNFSFDQGLLSQRSKEVLSQINNSESVSVLIEKGTHQLDFYTQAIEQISKLVSSPRLFLFIDDPDWSEANFVANNTVIVDFNIGTDRWMNLFLMTQCKHNI